jgi:hypothetical protein
MDEILTLEDGDRHYGSVSQPPYITIRPNRRQYDRETLAAAAAVSFNDHDQYNEFQDEDNNNGKPYYTPIINDNTTSNNDRKYARSRPRSPTKFTSKTYADSSDILLQKLPETWIKLLKESLPSLLMGLAGLLMAGALLDALPTWPVFQKVGVLFALVPNLLGLKGNLEMNLSSRLSTAANVGLLDHPTTRNRLILGNLALLQVSLLWLDDG